MKKIVALTLVLVMVLALCACGGGSKTAAGTWKLTGMTQDGQDYSQYLSMLGMEITMVLNDDGTGTMEAMGEKVDVTWDANGITSQGETISYTLDGDKLTVTQNGSSIIFVKIDPADRIDNAAGLAELESGEGLDLDDLVDTAE